MTGSRCLKFKGGTPVLSGGGPEGVLDTQQAVCLLRSCRRTFLFHVSFLFSRSLGTRKFILVQNLCGHFPLCSEVDISE